ncbi:serine/threonine protein kinase [Pontibacter qinzhouensis]|nr:serine/threonine-protein kinase [Pontibacter qinzhouensis]
MPTLHKDNVFANRFQLAELISSRGISELWKAQDLEENGAVVALRVFAPQGVLDEFTLDLLNKDLTKMISMSHPNLLRPYLADEYQGLPYLVLPYLANGSLRKRLNEEGPLSEGQLAQLLQQVGAALFYLHAHELPTLHQNLNPDNILISDNGDYIVTDYGLSSRTRSAIRKVIGQGATVSAEYSPPELFSAKPKRNAASDIFSLGVILYEACTGEVPWMGNGGISLLQGAAIPVLPFKYSRELQLMVKACLDPDWEKRPSAAELETEGRYYLEHDSWKSFGRFGTVTVKMVQYEKEKPWTLIWLGATFLVVLLATGYIYFFAPDLWQKLMSPATVSATVINSKAASQNTTTDSTAAADPVATVQIPDKELEEAEPTIPAAATTTPQPVASKTRRAVANPPRRYDPTEEPRMSYRKPTSLAGLLQQLPNDGIPMSVREQWRSDIQRYFVPEAIVSFTASGNVTGVFTVNEMVDKLLNAEPISNIHIDNMSRNDKGKIEELSIRVTSDGGN